MEMLPAAEEVAGVLHVGKKGSLPLEVEVIDSETEMNINR